MNGSNKLSVFTDFSEPVETSVAGLSTIWNLGHFSHRSCVLVCSELLRNSLKDSIPVWDLLQTRSHHREKHGDNITASDESKLLQNCSPVSESCTPTVNQCHPCRSLKFVLNVRLTNPTFTLRQKQEPNKFLFLTE